MNVLKKENKGKSPEFCHINQSYPSLFYETVLTPNFQMNGFKQRLQVNCMISDFTICTVYFLIVNDSYSMFHIDTTHLKQDQVLWIDFTACFGHVTCIHCEVVNLPHHKEEQEIPEPYSLFDNPYELQL